MNLAASAAGAAGAGAVEAAGAATGAVAAGVLAAGAGAFVSSVITASGRRHANTTRITKANRFPRMNFTQLDAL